MSTQFALVVRFTCHDQESAEGFDALIKETLEGIKANEPGTLAYVVHNVVDEPLVRVFYELYADRAAFEAHEQQPHTRNFLTSREQYTASVEVTWLSGATGKAPLP